VNARFRRDAAAILLSTLLSSATHAQTIYSEDFTGTTTTNPWYFFNGACLTAGTGGAGTSPGQIPSCSSIGASYYNENLVGGANGVSGSAQTLPDPTGSGALRFTNGNPGGYHQNGAIVSGSSFSTGAGVQITFKTVTYRGDSGGGARDGADGISFYLMDGSQAAGVGAWGGSLGYTCSNANPPYDGLVGGYLGLGIDEYGNFLNQGDNTATGYNYVPGRIGLRGAGNVAWSWLNANYPTQYPSTWTAANKQAAVQNTCKNGLLTKYDGTLRKIGGVNVPVADYAVIPNAYKVLSGVQIANESAIKRSDATPIFYNLKITQDGLLSFAYSINGGAYQPVITKQSITASNGPLPSGFRFGFAGSTGGSTNIHEIMCFKAAPADQSGSSTSVNEKQAAKVETGTQAYFAFYNPGDWTGRLTANSLIDTNGIVTVNTTANWDASCRLTGVASGGVCPTTGVLGPTAAEAPTARVMLTWDGTRGIPLEWNSLTSSQQSTLDAGDAVANANRLNYFRGDRTNEVNTSGVGLYRARDGVLGDIIDSSPTWVGPPSAAYTAHWKDRLYPAAAAPETSYLSYVATAQTRLNVVYGGANDGFLHGFRTGSFSSGGAFVDNSTTPNDGVEVFAYMPGAVLNAIHNQSDSTLDYANTQYAHNFYVDATPGTGDLFYSGAWHTWVAGGLGPGGAAIYALDVTNPDPTNFTESNAAALVIGEWNPATITCQNVPSCGGNLGNTFGTPQIRRFHNGMWGVVFGNGFSSATGDAGIYVMTIDPVTSAQTFYYLSTGATGANGIAFVASADLDGDQVTDYIYAGDLQGNVWRFDLTNNDPTFWAAGASPMFTTPSGQPITSKLLVVATAVVGGPPRLMVEFGTGRKTPLTVTTPVNYASGSQDLYGVWDWNLSDWNMKSAAQFQSLDATAAATGLSTPYTLGKSNLLQQTVTVAAGGVRNGSSLPVCWQGGTQCAFGNDRFGWYLDLPGSAEQIVFNPIFYQGAFIVDSTVPANNVPTACTTNSDTGFTYVLAVGTGGTFTSAFSHRRDALVTTIGVETDATGSPYVVTTAEQTSSLIFQTVTGIPGSQQINLPSNAKAARLTWVELR
jgi:type IV pilus assembly protein PilY1